MQDLEIASLYFDGEKVRSSENVPKHDTSQEFKFRILQNKEAISKSCIEGGHECFEQ